MCGARAIFPSYPSATSHAFRNRLVWPERSHSGMHDELGGSDYALESIKYRSGTRKPKRGRLTHRRCTKQWCYRTPMGITVQPSAHPAPMCVARPTPRTSMLQFRPLRARACWARLLSRGAVGAAGDRQRRQPVRRDVLPSRFARFRVANIMPVLHPTGGRPLAFDAGMSDRADCVKGGKRKRPKQGKQKRVQRRDMAMPGQWELD